MENLTLKRCLAPVLGANQSQTKSSLQSDSLSAPSSSSSYTNSSIAEFLWESGMD